MDWLGDLLVPTYVALLSVGAYLIRSIVKLVARLTSVEHGVDRLEEKVDNLSVDLRSHMQDEGTNIMRLERAIARRNSEDAPHEVD
jgi:hypothetical protein